MSRPTNFVVSRLNWRESAGVWFRLPGETRMASFDTADKAAADRAKREQAARDRVNPFRCGNTWAERTAMPEPVFRDYLQDANIPLPDGDGWEEWWTATAPTLTADQRTRVWEALTSLRFYKVDERPARPVAYAVVQIGWQYNDQWYYPDAEGGTVVTLYRTRARAEEEAAEQESVARQMWREGAHGEPEHFDFHMEGRRFSDQDPFDSRRRPPSRENVDPDHNYGHFGTDEVPFYEVIEVELEGGGA